MQHLLLSAVWSCLFLELLVNFQINGIPIACCCVYGFDGGTRCLSR
jgi:hypothetical protein